MVLGVGGPEGGGGDAAGFERFLPAPQRQLHMQLHLRLLLLRSA
jgi:hypothetical protein